MEDLYGLKYKYQTYIVKNCIKTWKNKQKPPPYDIGDDYIVSSQGS